jgi:osmotically-inducible protein OsmY
MNIAKRLTIVSSAIILAAGCSSNQERRASYSESGSSPAYSGATSDERVTSSSIAARTAGQEGPSESDRTLTTQVQALLKNEGTVAVIAPNLQIMAQNGTVTLSGSVKSDQEKQRMESTIRSISGVVSVNNQLQVSLQPASDPSGRSSRIYSEAPSQSASINSDSATQSSVSSPNPEQSPTETKASSPSDTKEQTSAVVAVNAEPATQDSTATDQTQGAKEQPALSPTSDKANATSRVYSKDQSDSAASSTTSQTVDASNVNIQAATEADRSLGQQILKDVRADTALVALVPTIKIKVDDGKVTLRGTVKSEQEKQNLEASVQKVSGVTSVDNQLKVSGSGQTDTSNTSSKAE